MGRVRRRPATRCEVTQRLGKEAAFLATGGSHHQIGLNLARLLSEAG